LRSLSVLVAVIFGDPTAMFVTTGQALFSGE
jgi:hypothetical protein